MYRFWIVSALLVATGCGRFFHTDLRPAALQEAGMTVNDDGSVTYQRGRLTVSLRPMSDAELNRQFAADSEDGAASTNPYTYGDWQPADGEPTPSRFIVMRLDVANYEYPKVRLAPAGAAIAADTGRRYQALAYSDLYDYYRGYWLGRTGEGRQMFRARTDILKRTMATDDFIFSGAEAHGFIVFPLLDDEVASIRVDLPDIGVRFGYADQPLETIDLQFRFEREVLRGRFPADAARAR
jgi:hypothetical protein